MNEVNVFDFDNTDDLSPEVAALVEANVQSNPVRETFIALLASAPRALTYKELYVAGMRSGLVTDKKDDNGEPMVDEDGMIAKFPAISSVGQWLRSTNYGAVQIKRGYYAVKGSDADNGDRYEHVVGDKSEGGEQAAPATVEHDDLDDLGDITGDVA